MALIPDSVEKLIEEFSKFPGIGKKTAQRMSFFVLKSPNEQIAQMAEALLRVKTHIIFCSVCGGITEEDPCRICSDSKRNKDLICVVEDAADIFAFERTNRFNGVYHVLGGVLSPLDGVGPDDLNIDGLIQRANDGMEIVIATNPSVEGDTTALYLGKVLQEKDIRITRLARGLPVGSDLEYTDDATLIRAMEGRTSL